MSNIVGWMLTPQASQGCRGYATAITLVLVPVLIVLFEHGKEVPDVSVSG